MKKGFGDLFSESWNEYFAKFISILKVFLLLYVLPIVVFVIIAVIMIVFVLGISSLSGMAISGFDVVDTINLVPSDLTSQVSNTIIIAFIPIVVILLLGFIALSLLSTLAYINIGFSKNNNLPFKKAFKGGLKYFWIFLGLVIVQSLAVLGLFILLIIPGIIFLVYWIFSPYVLFSENKGIIDSMKRSKALVKGRWWRVFGNFLLLSLIIIAISILLSFIPFFGKMITYLFTTPFTIIFFKNLYLDLRTNLPKQN